MEVPRVDDDVTGARVVDEDGDVVVISLGLGEGVVQNDIDIIGDGLVGVELGDDDAFSVGIEQVGQPDHHDVVVVDERDAQRPGSSRSQHRPYSSVGVYTTARRGGYVEC